MLIREGHILYLVLNTKDNLLSKGLIAEISKILDELEHFEGKAVLVTIGRGKRFSLGFDL